VHKKRIYEGTTSPATTDKDRSTARCPSVKCYAFAAAVGGCSCEGADIESRRPNMGTDRATRHRGSIFMGDPQECYRWTGELRSSLSGEKKRDGSLPDPMYDASTFSYCFVCNIRS